jgi:cyclophilin family peptidyl-prolyl cis-trans isomerase
MLFFTNFTLRRPEFLKVAPESSEKPDNYFYFRFGLFFGVNQSKYNPFNAMKKFLFLSLLSIFGFIAIASNKVDEAAPKTYVVISTEYGEIKALLYDETPLHRDNMVKNVQAGIYDSLLFHRVINNFMIQGGDINSKDAQPGELLGGGSLEYTVQAEFNPNLFHKKGALCAARLGDDMNPSKASSSTQFYIVQGTVFTDDILNKMEAKSNQAIQNAICFELLKLPEYQDQAKRFNEAREAKDQVATIEVYNEMKPKILDEQKRREAEFKFTDAQREAYKTVGGTPHLDGNYTVFGEVVSGLEVVDKIAKEAVDGNSRPKKDIRFSIKIVYE